MWMVENPMMRLIIRSFFLGCLAVQEDNVNPKERPINSSIVIVS